jgi:hypothetical protein
MELDMNNDNVIPEALRAEVRLRTRHEQVHRLARIESLLFDAWKRYYKSALDCLASEEKAYRMDFPELPASETGALKLVRHFVAAASDPTDNDAEDAAFKSAHLALALILDKAPNPECHCGKVHPNSYLAVAEQIQNCAR